MHSGLANVCFHPEPEPAPAGRKVNLSTHQTQANRGAPRVKNYKKQDGVWIGRLPLDGRWEGDNKWVTKRGLTFIKEGNIWTDENGKKVADCDDGPRQPEPESTRNLRESLRAEARQRREQGQGWQGGQQGQGWQSGQGGQGWQGGQGGWGGGYGGQSGGQYGYGGPTY